MTAKIIYQGDLHCEAEHIRSGIKINSDAPIDNNGKGEAFSPTDLVAAALGTCILTIMGIKARDKEIDMKGATIDIQKTMVNNPRRIAALDTHVTMPANEYSDKEKKILEAAAHHCPVARSLHPDLKETITFTWL